MSVGGVPGVTRMTVSACTVAVTCVTAVPWTVALSRVAAAYALERHGRETGASEEQQECVQIHVSIEAVVGRRAFTDAQECASDRPAATPEGYYRSPPATSNAGGQLDRNRMTETFGICSSGLGGALQSRCRRPVWGRLRSVIPTLSDHSHDHPHLRYGAMGCVLPRDGNRAARRDLQGSLRRASRRTGGKEHRRRDEAGQADG